MNEQPTKTHPQSQNTKTISQLTELNLKQLDSIAAAGHELGHLIDISKNL